VCVMCCVFLFMIICMVVVSLLQYVQNINGPRKLEHCNSTGAYLLSL
jgi:hypothetical protein